MAPTPCATNTQTLKLSQAGPSFLRQSPGLTNRWHKQRRAHCNKTKHQRYEKYNTKQNKTKQPAHTQCQRLFLPAPSDSPFWSSLTCLDKKLLSRSFIQPAASSQAGMITTNVKDIGVALAKERHFEAHRGKTCVRAWMEWIL